MSNHLVPCAAKHFAYHHKSHALHDLKLFSSFNKYEDKPLYLVYEGVSYSIYSKVTECTKGPIVAVGLNGRNYIMTEGESL